MDEINQQPYLILAYYRLIYQKSLNFFSKSWAQLLLIIILGTVLRLINLGEQPYWGDEAFAAGVLRHYHNLGDLLQYISLIEYYPPLSFILLHFWSNVFGESVLVMRLPSMIFGVLTIWVTYLFGQAMFRGRRVGLYAALIVAVLPIQIHFSQSIRPYTLLAILGLLATFAYAKYRFQHHLFFIIIYVVSAILGMYSHYSFIFVLVPLAAFWLIEVIFRKTQNSKGHNFIIWLSVHAVIFLVFYPWLKFFFYKLIFHGYELFSIPPPAPLLIRALSFFSINFDQMIWMTKGEPVNQVEVFAVWLVKLVFISFVGYLFLMETDKIRRLLKDNIWPFFLLLWMIIMPTTIYLFSGVSVPYTPMPQQHIILVSIMLIMLLAIILDQVSVRSRLLLLSLLLISLMTFTINVVSDDSLWDAQYRLKDIAEYINNNYREGDVVVAGYNILRTDLNYFLRPELSTIGFYPINYYNIDYFNSRDAMGLVETEFHFRIGQPTKQELFSRMDRLVQRNKAKRIWFTFFIWPAWLEDWAQERGWQKKFMSPLPKIFPLEMYDKQIKKT